MSKGDKFMKLVDNYLANPTDDRQRRDILIKINRKFQGKIDKFCNHVGITLNQFERNLSRALYMRTKAEKYGDLRQSFYSSTAQKDIYHRPNRHVQKKELNVFK